MCGIHGILSSSKVTSNSSLSKFIEQGFIVNVVRGMDSSGVFLVDRKKKAWSHKLALPGPFFVENKMTKSYVTESAFAKAVVCHVRAATMGKVNVDNAHPFVGYKENGEYIVGVHNGTLSGWHSRKGAKLFDVDSDWAMSRIAEDGADAFEDFSGAWAFVWWDSGAEDTVYMARNKERPLHFVLTPDGENLLFASEPGMLAWLCERNNIKIKDDEIHVLEEDMLYTFDTGQQKISWSKSHLPKPRYSSSSSSSYHPSQSSTSSTYRQPYTQQSNATQNAAVTTAAAANTDKQDTAIADLGDDDIPFDNLPDSAVSTINLFRAALESSPPVNEQEEDHGNVVTFPKKLSKAERKRLRRLAQERKRESREQSCETTSCGTQEFGSDKDTVPEGYFSKQSASEKEITSAKSAGMYASMQMFVGLTYEPDTNECWGEIEDFIPGHGKVRYQAVIRNTTASIAHRVYIKGRGVYVAVVGRVGEEVTAGGALVVAPLTKEGVEKFAKALS